MSEKIVLIDGHSILNRAFYGIPDLTNSEGLHTNAVYGFLNIMLKILDEESPEYLTVAFDVKHPTFRHEMYAEYKGTRKPMPEELREQVPLIQEMLRAMGVRLVMKEGYEADDILGTIAKQAESEGMDVSLVSGDRDLLQLASEKILIRIPKTSRGGTKIEDYHTQEVVEKYGVTPVQIIDLKGLMGDTADNIPGVAGVGEKTAVKVLTQFASVEEAYEHLEEITPKRTHDLLEKGREQAFLSKKLATIKTDCELDFSFSEAVLPQLFNEYSFAMVKKLEFKSLLKRFDTDQMSKTNPVPDIEYLSDQKAVQNFLKKMYQVMPQVAGLGFLGDTWTSQGARNKHSSNKHSSNKHSPNKHSSNKHSSNKNSSDKNSLDKDFADQDSSNRQSVDGHISNIYSDKVETGGEGAQLTLVFDEERGDVYLGEEGEKDFPFYGVSISYENAGSVITGCAMIDSELTGEYLLGEIRQMITKLSGVSVIGWKDMMHMTVPEQDLSDARGYHHDLAPVKQEAFPDQTIEERQRLFEKISDMEIAAYLIDPLKNTYQVDDIARDHLGMTIASYEELFGKQSIRETVLSMKQAGSNDASKLNQYLANLSFVACLAYPVMEKKLVEQDMWKLFREVEMPTVYYLYQMERIGVRADRKVLEDMSEKLAARVNELEKEIHDLAGEEFNINSPKQLGVILFDKMKLPFAKKTKTGYSTSADILEKLKYEDPIIDKILEYRQVSKLKSTYADGLPVFIEEDQRIHGKFNQTITATGRISSTDPNLQNIPIRMELGRQLRKVFIPKEGCVFLDADYSQIELRVLAHLSGDPELIEAYTENLDIHRSTASKVFHVPFDEVTSLQRRNAKAVNFGIIYGISSFGLGQDLNVSRKEAEQFIEQYFETYPDIKSYLDGLVASAKKNGHTLTMFGRRRPVPELSSSNYMQRSFGERIAMNAPIQGTAADIIKIAMIRVSDRLFKEGLKSRVVLQVHDELLVETEKEEVDQVKQILEEEMVAAADLKVPLIVEVEQGESWYEAH